MQSVNYNYFLDHFRLLGIKKGDYVVVHSRLISFGKIEGGISSVIQALISAVGPSGSIILPTYTLNLKESDIYDPLITPSINAGALPEFARNLNIFERTFSPLHSHIVFGANKENILKINPFKSFGENTIFSLMLGLKYKLLLLGCNFNQGATYLHQIEALHGVPYRGYIFLKRLVKLPSQNVEQVQYEYYARLQPRIINNFAFFQEKITQRSEVKSEKTILGESFSVELDFLTEFGLKELKQNPLCLINK